MNRDEAIKRLKEVYEVDLTEVEPPDTHKITKIYFGGDAPAAALASAAVMAKIFAKPTEGGLALTMEEHAGLQIVYATAAPGVGEVLS